MTECLNATPGITTESAWVVPTFASIGAAALLVALLIAWICLRKERQLTCDRLRWEADDSLAVARPLPDALTFHIFLSHSWLTGQNQMRLCKDKLTRMVPNMSVFLDVSPPHPCLSRLDALILARLQALCDTWPGLAAQPCAC